MLQRIKQTKDSLGNTLSVMLCQDSKELWLHINNTTTSKNSSLVKLSELTRLLSINKEYLNLFVILSVKDDRFVKISSEGKPLVFSSEGDAESYIKTLPSHQKSDCIVERVYARTM